MSNEFRAATDEGRGTILAPRRPFWSGGGPAKGKAGERGEEEEVYEGDRCTRDTRHDEERRI